MTTVRRFDRLRLDVSGREAIDPETGFLDAAVHLTRTGVFVYRKPDGSLLRELRHPDDVFAPAHMASLERLIATNGHPRDAQGRPIWVNADNARQLWTGHLGSAPRRDTSASPERIKSSIKLTDRKVIDEIFEHQRFEVSLAYECEIVDEAGVWDGEPYDVRQVDLKANACAVNIDFGRAGPTCRLNLDEGDAVLGETPQTREPRTGAPAPASPSPKTVKTDRSPAMTTIRFRIDTFDVEAEPHVASIVTTALQTRDKLVEDLQGKIKVGDAASAELVTAKAKIAELEKAATEAKAANTDSTSAAEVVGVLLDAQKLVTLNADQLQTFAKAKPADIRRAVLLHRAGNTDEARKGLEGLSDDRVAGKFDALVEAAPAAGTGTPTQTDGVGALLVALGDSQPHRPGAPAPGRVSALDSALDAIHFGPPAKAS